MSNVVLLAEKAVYVKEGHIVCNSLVVAEVFKKGHNHVLRDIRNLEIPEEWALRNFGQCSYINENNREMPMIEMTYEGFCLLVMGFTGREATLWKISFIEKFRQLAEEVNRKKYALPMETRIRLAKLDRPRICAPTTPQERDVMADLYRDGYGIRRVAKKTGRAYSTVYGVIARSGLLRHRDDVTGA